MRRAPGGCPAPVCVAPLSSHDAIDTHAASTTASSAKAARSRVVARGRTAVAPAGCRMAAGRRWLVGVQALSPGDRARRVEGSCRVRSTRGHDPQRVSGRTGHRPPASRPRQRAWRTSATTPTISRKARGRSSPDAPLRPRGSLPPRKAARTKPSLTMMTARFFSSPGPEIPALPHGDAQGAEVVRRGHAELGDMARRRIHGASFQREVAVGVDPPSGASLTTPADSTSGSACRRPSSSRSCGASRDGDI